MRTVEEAMEYFGKDRYAVQNSGIQIDAVGDSYAKCSFEIQDRHLGARDHVMGGAIFTLADFTFAVASNTEERFTMTASANISIYHQPKGKRVIAECKAIRDGRRASFYETIIYDELDTLIGKVSFTGITVTQ